MAQLESFSTIGLDPRRKLAFWNDRASESFSPLVSEPEDIRVFNGSIVRGSIGDMTRRSPTGLLDICGRRQYTPRRHGAR